MIFFYSVILIILIYGSLFPNKIRNTNKIIMTIEFFLIIACAFRGINEISNNDTFVYKTMYENSAQVNFSTLREMYPSLEITFLFLISAFNFFHIPYRLFLILTSFISLGGIFSYINLNAKNKFLSIMLFFCLGGYFLCFTSIRQTISIGIAFFFMRFLTDKNKKIFIIGVLISSLFHQSSIIFMILVVLDKIKSKIFFLLSIIGILIILLSPIDWISMIMGGKYDYYLTGASTVSIKEIFQSLFFLLLIVLSNIDFKKSNLNQIQTLNKASLTFYFFQLCSFRIALFSRITLSFQPFYILNVANNLEQITNRYKRRRLILFVVLISLIYFVVWMYLNREMNYI